MKDPVYHLEARPGRSACSRALPTAGFFTDDEAVFEEREGSRCKSCWRIHQRRVEMQDAADFDRPEAKAAREAPYAEAVVELTRRAEAACSSAEPFDVESATAFVCGDAPPQMLDAGEGFGHLEVYRAACAERDRHINSFRGMLVEGDELRVIHNGLRSELTERESAMDQYDASWHDGAGRHYTIDDYPDKTRDGAVTPVHMCGHIANAQVSETATVASDRVTTALTGALAPEPDRPAGWGRDLDAIEYEHTRAAEPDPRDEDGTSVGAHTVDCDKQTDAAFQCNCKTDVSGGCAVGIYACMARDPIDALEMIAECADRNALDTLLEMLTLPGSEENTDRKLNAMFVEPVQRRIWQIGIPVDPATKFVERGAQVTAPLTDDRLFADITHAPPREPREPPSAESRIDAARTTLEPAELDADALPADVAAGTDAGPIAPTEDGIK